MQQNFFVGVVENRKDPLELGRVQVRIFGVHTESLQDIPTASLPWAIPLMPAMSASMSGIGHSGTQYIEGTTVFLFFQDGDSKQQPIILGSTHGIPLTKSSFGDTGNESVSIPSTTATAKVPTNNNVTSTVKSSTNSTLQDSSGQPVLDGSNQPIKVTTDSKQGLKDALGKKESSNNYKAVNQLGYIGKYQMGAAMLTDLGYVKKGTKNRDLGDISVWTGKGGVTSKDTWLNNSVEQEKAMDAELVLNESRLKRMGVIDSNTTEQEKSGYLATSHLLGTGGTRDMKSGITKQDANGVTGQTYYNLGYKAVAGKSPDVAPDATTVDNPSREPSTKPEVGVTQSAGTAGSADALNTNTSNFGFSDPSGKYPRYLKEQDTNRLARNNNIGKTIVAIKEETEDKGVNVANGKGTWDQSPTPYNAQYPFNHVYESESGHIMEFDDTPNNERINLHHRSGTFQEWDRNGTEVRKIIGDKYEIWERNGYVHIKGSVNITVEGNANIQVGASCEMSVGGDLNARIGGNANWSIGGDWNVKTGGSENHSNGGSYAIDASEVQLNSGLSTANSLSSPTVSAQPVPEFSHLSLEPRGFSELADFEDGELSDSDVTKRQQKLAEAGLTDTVQEPAKMDDKKSEKADANKVEESSVSCGSFTSGNINVNDFISANYRLKDLTKGASIPALQGGIKDVELACNLKALAENVLEPIKRKYPDVIITSGLRPFSDNPKSQHPLGQAVDIQFTTKSSSDYVSIAKDLSGLIPFDQLILEYRTSVRRSGQPTTWIHVSFSRKSNKKQVFTMDNDKRVGDFGELRAIT